MRPKSLAGWFGAVIATTVIGALLVELRGVGPVLAPGHFERQGFWAIPGYFIAGFASVAALLLGAMLIGGALWFTVQWLRAGWILLALGWTLFCFLLIADLIAAGINSPEGPFQYRPPRLGFFVLLGLAIATSISVPGVLLSAWLLQSRLPVAKWLRKKLTGRDVLQENDDLLVIEEDAFRWRPP